MVEQHTQNQPSQRPSHTNAHQPDWLANLMSELEGWTLHETHEAKRYQLTAPANTLTTSAELALICKHLTNNAAIIHQLSGCQSDGDGFTGFCSPLTITFSVNYS